MIGWAIGRGEQYASPDEEDRVEAETLYRLLEHDVVPAFYDRGPDHLPQHWIARMRSSLGKLCYVFNTHRMVREYTERFYLIADARLRTLEAESAQRARALGTWLERIRRSWGDVRVEVLDDQVNAGVQVGETLHVRARIRLGRLTPDDVGVELYQGRVDAHGEIIAPVTSPMQCVGTGEGGCWMFEASARPCRHSGEHGYTVRVLPYHPDLSIPFVPGLITWAEPQGLPAKA